MPLLKNPAASRATVARATLAKAARPVMEALESRQLLSGTLVITNPYILPGNSNLMFNTMGTLNTYTPANVVHSQQTLTLRNSASTGTMTLSLTLSGPFAFVTANGNVTSLTNQTIAAGGTLTVTIAFTQSTVPAHTGNETNFNTNAADGAAIGGSLSVVSDASTSPNRVISLEGYFQQVSNNNEEPSLPTIVNTLAGYKTNLTVASGTNSGFASGQVDFTEGTTPTYYGSEVVSTNWQAANPASPVTVQQLDAFRTQGNTATLSWYTGNTVATLATHELFVGTAAQGQTLLPTSSDGGTTALKSNFTTSAAFGFRVDNEFSNDAINNAIGNTGGGGHHFRFFPLVDQTGTAVANTYIVAMDYGQAQAENFDFQDNVYIVSNIRPATTPDTPTNLTATTGAAPTLSWTASNYSPVGYKVYRSPTGAVGSYTLLTSSPITTTSYTDTTLGSATTAFYEVTAIDTGTLAESAPDTVTANPGPVVASYTLSAVQATPLSFDALASATDASSTIVPSTLLISTAPNQGGTAVANSDGTITYTPSSTFSGTETLQYTVADAAGVRSQPGTVTFNVTAPASTTPSPTPTPTPTTTGTTPTFNSFVGLTLANTAVKLNVLSTATSNVTLAATNPVTIATQPTRGTAVANSDGSITYTPSTDDVGADEFTYRAVSSAGIQSTPVTVDVNVGVALNSATASAPAYNAVTFTDEDKTQVTVSLNKGVADIYFDGIGLYTAPGGKSKTLIVSGGASNDLHIRTIALSGTTTASALTIKGAQNGAVTFGGVTDAAPLGTLSAKTSNLVTNGGSSTPVLGNAAPAGYIGLAGVKSVSLGTAINATISLGSGAGVASTAVAFAGTVSGTALTSGSTVSKLSASNWIASAGNTPGPITAPAINSLAVKGEFDAELLVNGNLGSATVGTVNDGTWTIHGNAKSITMTVAAVASPTATATGFSGLSVDGTLSSMTVKTGNLAADVTAGAIGTLKVAGALTGNVTTTGNLNALTVGALSNSTVDVGTTATLSTVTAATIGSAILKTLTVTGKGTTPVFNDSQVIAHSITSATTGLVNAATTNSEGIAAVSFKSATVKVNNGSIHLNAAALASASALEAYLKSKGETLGTFDIDIVTAAN